MTLAELKELLATMGVNDEERNAPVFVTINDLDGVYRGTVAPVTGGEVDYGNHPDDPAEGTFVMLTVTGRRANA